MACGRLRGKHYTHHETNFTFQGSNIQRTSMSTLWVRISLLSKAGHTKGLNEKDLWISHPYQKCVDGSPIASYCIQTAVSVLEQQLQLIDHSYCSADKFPNQLIQISGWRMSGRVVLTGPPTAQIIRKAAAICSMCYQLKVLHKDPACIREVCTSF